MWRPTTLRRAYENGGTGRELHGEQRAHLGKGANPTTEGVEELRKYKGKTKTVSLDGFKFHAAIDSLALGKNQGLLLHAPKRASSRTSSFSSWRGRQ